MALSDKRIREEMKKGNIVIFPFNPSHLATSSYDVVLGSFYFREQKPKVHRNIYDIWSQTHMEAVWGTKVHQAKRAGKILPHLRDFDSIRASDQIILLEPGETILAHTEEFIGGRNTITTMMKARSSLGRSFIEVCKCAGWGDVGFTSRWTMEITNNSTHYTIPLVVGRRIAQIVFFETGPTSGNYVKNGKYQTTPDIKELRKQWKPEMMLPRLYMDREVKR